MTEQQFTNGPQWIAFLADEQRRAQIIASCDQQLDAAEQRVQEAEALGLVGLGETTTDTSSPPKKQRKNRNLGFVPSLPRPSGSSDGDGGAASVLEPRDQTARPREKLVMENKRRSPRHRG